MNIFGRTTPQIHQSPEESELDETSAILLKSKMEQAQALAVHYPLLSKGKSYKTRLVDLIEPEKDKNPKKMKTSLLKKKKLVMDEFIREKAKLLPLRFPTIQSLRECYNHQKEPRLNRDLVHWDLNCHNGPVTTVTFSNDGKRIISGSKDNTIRVFDVEKMAQVDCVFTDHKDGINSISVSADNRYVATASADLSMMVFDLETKEKPHYVGQLHKNSIQFVNMTKDNKYLISAGLHEAIKIYDLERKMVVCEFQESARDNVESIVVSNDGKMLAYVANKTSIKVFDIHDFNTMEEIRHFQEAHGIGQINCLAFSKDSRYLVSGANEVKVFDLKTKQEVQSFQGHSDDPVRSVMISNNNKTIVAGSEKGSVRIFDLDLDQQVHEFSQAHKGIVRSVAISPDDMIFVTASEDSTLKMYNLETFKEIHHFRKAHHSGVTKLAVSKDSKYIVSGFEDNSVRIIDLRTGEEVSHFDNIHTQRISAVRVTNNNKYIVSAGRDSVVKMYDIEKNSEVCSMRNVHKDPITTMIISKDDKYVLTGSSDGSMKVLAVGEKDLKEIHHFEKVVAGAITSISLTKDNKFITVGSNDHSVKMFDFDTKEQVFHLTNVINDGFVYNFLSAASSDGKFLVAAKTVEMKIIDIKSKNVLFDFYRVHQEPINAITISDDDRYLITCSGQQTIKVFDLQTGQQLHDYSNLYSEPLLSVAVSGDNQKIVVGAGDGSISVWNLERNQQLHHMTNTHYSPKSVIALTKDDRYLAAGSEFGYIKVFDMQTKEEIHEFKEAHKDGVYALVATTKYIISAGDDRSIKIYDIYAKTEVYAFRDAHKDRIVSLAISNDERYVASGSVDGYIKVFDLEKMQEIHSFYHTKNLEKPVSALAITHDDRFLISASEDFSIKIYEFENCQEIFTFTNAHKAPIGSLAVTHNNKLLISSSKSAESVKVWDLETMQEAHHFGNPPDTYTVNRRIKTNISITKDDRYAIVLLGEELPKVYDLKIMQEVHQFKHVGMNLPQSSALSRDSKTLITSHQDGTIQFHRMPFTEDNEIYFLSSQIPAFQLVGEYDAMLFKQFTSSSIENKDKFLSLYQDLHIAPHNWTILHLMAIFRPSDVSQVAVYPHFKTPFLLDSYGKTPLHYLIAHDNLDYPAANIMLKYILDYLEDITVNNPYEYKATCNSLTDLFPFIVSKMTPRLAHKYLELCFRKSTGRHNEDIPSFGVEDIQYTFAKTPTLNPDIQAKIYEEGEDQVTFKTSMLHLDYDPTSNDMINTVKMLTSIEDEGIFEAPVIEHLINYLWRKTMPIMVITALLFSVLMILIMVFVGKQKTSGPIAVIILIITGLFAGMEAIQLYTLKWKYIMSFWNIIDVFYLGLIVAFIALKYQGSADADVMQWVVAVLLMGGFLRWISYLRLFTPTRVLIQIIITVLWDMWGFILIILSIILAFSMIFLTFSRNNSSSSDTSEGYMDHLYSTYKVMYGEIDDGDYNTSQDIVLSIILFMLNVVLLNLLISIMGDSYSKVQDKRALVDSLTRLDMILESIVVTRALFGRDRTSEKGYLIYCEPENMEEEDAQKIEWEERIEGIRKLLENNIGKMKDRMDKTEEEMKRKMETLEKMMVNNHNDVMKAIKGSH